ncbi:MAG: TlyA family RNA methyltransferase [Clostridia bacterium]|nr:TlyA family RNA methyltransferase [Clostridia bacterium]
MRLDKYLFSIKLFESTTKAQQAIKRKEIYIDGRLVDKSSFFIDQSKQYNVERKFNSSFVSLGGYKLEKALKDFNFEVNSLTCCDIGCSTGGFTDCLLQNGAKQVFAIDLNDELLCDKLKNDKRVKLIIKNAKLLSKNDFDSNLDFICADLSFISATTVLGVFYSLLEEGNYAIILCKPQFEMKEKIKFKNGIIKDEKYRKKALNDIYDSAISVGFSVDNITIAPLKKDKNIEYLMLLKKTNDISNSFEDLYKQLKY